MGTIESHGDLIRRVPASALGTTVPVHHMVDLDRLQQERAREHIGRGTSADVYKLVGGRGAPLALKVFLPNAAWLGEFGIPAYVKDSGVNLDNLLMPELLVVTGGRLAMLMPLGRSVRDLPVAQMAASEIFNYAWCLARGMKNMHQAGVVHRDIKPANTIQRLGDGVVRQNKYGFVDFGAAAILSGAGVWAGPANRTTPNFRDPETCLPAALSKTANGRQIDVWATGLTIFYVLSGGTYLVRAGNGSLRVNSPEDVLAGVERGIGKGPATPFAPRARGETAAAFRERQHAAHTSERDRIFAYLLARHVTVRTLVQSSTRQTARLATAVLRTVCGMLVRDYSLRLTAGSVFRALDRTREMPLSRHVRSPRSPFTPSPRASRPRLDGLALARSRKPAPMPLPKTEAQRQRVKRWREGVSGTPDGSLALVPYQPTHTPERATKRARHQRGSAKRQKKPKEKKKKKKKKTPPATKFIGFL